MKRLVCFLFTMCLFLHSLYACNKELSFVKDFAKKTFGDVKKIEKDNKGIWYKVYDKNNILVGRIIVSYGVAGEIKGYVGNVPVIAAIDEKTQEIIKVDFLPNKETQSFIDYIRKRGFLKNFIGIKWYDAPKKEFDTVSGATITTKAFIKTLKKMFEEARKKKCQGK